MVGIVGSIVLPVLGAVPDGAIVLFSGMGPRDQVEQQVAVGIGALAGSTIMLLTVPWCLSVVAGRVDLNANGTPNYRKKANGTKLSNRGLSSLLTTGVSCSREIAVTAYMMLGTALVYVVIQGPAFEDISKYGQDNQAAIASGVSKYALAGFVLTIACFAAYMWYMVCCMHTDHALVHNTTRARSSTPMSRRPLTRSSRRPSTTASSPCRPPLAKSSWALLPPPCLRRWACMCVSDVVSPRPSHRTGRS